MVFVLNILCVLTFMTSICNSAANIVEPAVNPYKQTHTPFKVDRGLAVQYRDGDVIIGALIGLHSRNSTGTWCGAANTYGVPAVETINMIIDEVNKNPVILPGIKLGSIALDTCGIDTHAVQMVVRETFPYFWDSSSHCVNGMTSTNISQSHARSFAGIIGAATSSVTILVSKVLQVYSIPQISYWSTNPDISNKALYPYVFRTVPSDTHQARAILGFIRSRNWSYISIIYEDTFYGIRGFTEIEELASNIGVCIAYSKRILQSKDDQDISYYDDIIGALLQERKARVVILFMDHHQAGAIMRAAIRSRDGRGYFVWIASDAWTGLLPTEADNRSIDEELQSCVGFLPKSEPVQRLNDYFTNIRLKDRTKEHSGLNPWFAQYLGSRLHCNVNDSSQNKPNQRWCGPNEHFTKQQFNQYSITQYISDATLALIYALDAYHKVICDGKPGACGALRCTAGNNKLAKDLLPFLRNVSFPATNGGEYMFDEHQDGPTTYDIRMYKYTSDRFEWARVGIFEKNDLVSSDTYLDDKLENISSICSNSCGQNEAKTSHKQTCCWTCTRCADNQYVGYNGSKCLDCPFTQKPNMFGNSCIPAYVNNLPVNSPYTIASLVVSSLGIVLELLVVIIYIKYRNSPIVKSSGKELCVIVFVGVFICNLEGFAIICGVNTICCAASRVIFAMGPCTMYAALLSKTIRVVIVFHSKMLKSHVKAYIRPKPQIFTTLAMVIVQGFILTIWFLTHPNGVKIIQRRGFDDFYYECSGSGDVRILISLFYSFLLILICTVLSTINRKVPTGFKETKFIGFTMYTTCIIWLAFLSIYLSNETNIPLKMMTSSVCLSLSSFTVLTCMFLPRCYDIVCHPERNTQRSIMHRKVTSISSKISGMAPSSGAREEFPS